MRTAIVLLLLLAGASILGTVIKQNASQQEYIKSYGQLGYAVIRSFNLDDVYGSAWYILLLLLLALNLVVCTVRRFASAWRRTFAPRVVVDPSEIRNYPKSDCITVQLTPNEVISQATLALKKQRYRAWLGSSKDCLFLYGVRGRVGIWGPYVTHLSILVIFVGAIVGGFFGSRGTLTIAEGKSSDVYWSNSGAQPLRLGFSIYLRRFEILTDKHRRPTAYRSYVEVREKGKLRRQQVIDVNRPLVYKGIAFYQSSFGLDGFVLSISSPKGETVRVNLGLSGIQGPQDLLKWVDIDGKQLALYVHNAAPDYVGGERINATDMPLNPACDLLITDEIEETGRMNSWTRLGWLQVGDSAEYKRYRVQLTRAVAYTVLDVSRNPGLPIVYAGFALLVIGVLLSFYVSRREIRVCSTEQEGKTVVTLGCSTTALDQGTVEDLELVRSAIGLRETQEEK